MSEFYERQILLLKSEIEELRSENNILREQNHSLEQKLSEYKFKCFPSDSYYGYMENFNNNKILNYKDDYSKRFGQFDKLKDNFKDE